MKADAILKASYPVCDFGKFLDFFLVFLHLDDFVRRVAALHRIAVNIVAVALHRAVTAPEPPRDGHVSQMTGDNSEKSPLINSNGQNRIHLRGKTRP